MNNVTAMINSMNIKMRTDNRFEGRITVNGNRKSFYGTTKAEIKQKAKEYLQKVENGYREPQSIVLNEYIEYWLETYKYNRIEPSSYDKLERTYNNQIKETIGRKKMGDITSKDIQQLINEHASGARKPLAKSGLKKILHLLNPCFRKAMQEGIIYDNPCKDVDLPIDSAILIPTKEQFALSDGEMEALKNECLAKYKNGSYKYRNGLILMIMLNTGLRVGEMLALEWRDINIEDRTIHIYKTMQSNLTNRNKNIDRKTIDILKMSPKTKSGVRFISINDNIIYYINQLKKFDEENEIHSPYVCCTRTGTREVARNLQRTLNNVQKKTNIKKHITLHTLRHSFGSSLIRKGISIAVVSQLMGHANISITYNKYIHTIKEEEVKAMDMIEIC